MTTDYEHRLWLLAWCGRHGKSISGDLIRIFIHRMNDQIKTYERQEPGIDLELLECIRIRECAKLLKEAGHG